MKLPVITLLFFASTSVALPAMAEEDPQRVQAEGLFREGLSLHDAHRDAEAYEKLEKAYALFPAPNVLFLMARTEQIMGRRLMALRHYREALANPLLAKMNVRLAKEYIEELEPAFGRVLVKGPDGTVVIMDGREFRLPMSEAFDVEPVAFTVTGRRDSEMYQAQVHPVAGRTTTVEFARKPPLDTPQAKKEMKKEFWTGERVVGVTLGGLAVVAAGVGVGFMVTRNGHVSDANLLAVDPNVCRVQASASCANHQSAVDSANRARTGEIVWFVAAGALAVGAAVLLWPRHPTEGSQVTARVIPTGQGFLIDGAF